MAVNDKHEVTFRVRFCMPAPQQVAHIQTKDGVTVCSSWATPEAPISSDTLIFNIALTYIQPCKWHP